MDFSHCKDEKQAKEVYRKLAKTYHPDAGGSNEKMQQLTKNYDACLERLKLGSAPRMENEYSNRRRRGWQSWGKTNDSRAYGYFYAGGPSQFNRGYTNMGPDEKVEDPLKREFYTSDNPKSKDEIIKELRISIVQHSRDLLAAKEEANKWHKAYNKAQSEAASANSRMWYMNREIEKLKSQLNLEMLAKEKSIKCHNRLKNKFNKFKEKFIPKTESLT